MIVLNLIFLEVQFECDFLKKNLVKILVYRYAGEVMAVFAIPILFRFSPSRLSSCIFLQLRSCLGPT